ncbi:MAG: hypothetical protein EXX96DRAFT_532969 [Benjaminiella poitrasii]|nr:MAG: hypothetical protein EXX96DRAFT_532969 [Benjaminiella poitrasii]
MFRNMVKSDGYAIGFIFNRKKRSNAPELIENNNLTLDDFNFEAVKNTYRPAFLDPVRKSVFCASLGLDNKNHQIRQCTMKEYFHMTGSTRYLKKLQQMKANRSIDTLESSIPSPKTTKADQYSNYITYLLQHIDQFFFPFYNFDTAKDRFHLYQGRQQAADNMVNIIINGSSKYNKIKRKNVQKNRKNKKEKDKNKNKKTISKGKKKEKKMKAFRV